ncbi:unnamed protein product [Didymodactylos carnosus]|uniref:Ubiquitin-like domain-containing protein n=1 Tax=Didymodactylos carnosus TaxID=1234261 RepID=A0A813NFV9_9BILA|nr:unnamed protein product [Didymodactylos carnosus]CAF3517398.1 unnamed protein product [Didymodactylos carnosus]
MNGGEINSRYFILHLGVLHGSDRYEVHLHMEREPLVRDLQEELEKKARVMVANQKLMFRGQRLHQCPDTSLSSLGIFNGNQIILIGEKLKGAEDTHYGRLLSIEKDVQLIDDVLELICRDFEKIKGNATNPRQCSNLLVDLHARAQRCNQDLNKFDQVANNVTVDSSEYEALRKKNEVLNRIKDRLDITNNVSSAISTYGSQTQS